jgi:hypothetical protein
MPYLHQINANLDRPPGLPSAKTRGHGAMATISHAEENVAAATSGILCAV